MKSKPNKDMPELTVDRGPRQAESRRKARGAHMNRLGLNACDDRAINQEIGKHIKRAKSLRDRVGELTDSEKYELLSDAMAVFLLASEPKYRQLNIERVCVRDGVTVRSNTRFIHLVVRALGRYAAAERRKAHRDSMAIEYAMSQGTTPSTLVSYFSTPGQGLDATHRRAVEYFRSNDRKTPRKISITVELKVDRQIRKVPSDGPVIGYIKDIKRSPRLTSCITDPYIINAVLVFVEQLMEKAKSSTHNASGTVSKGAHRVIGKRPTSQSQASGVQARIAPLARPTAKSPPYNQDF
jgi:hypothetical protein